MKEMWTHISYLGENADPELFQHICEEVFEPFGHIEILDFPGCDNTGDLDLQTFNELLEEAWSRYVNQKEER